MEDAVKKSRTDCVYYLASPLTCKKGSECEFRHSENARLNPRDCYYWLNGNCRNLTCPFRHPPLEAFTESTSNPVPFPSYSAAPTNKSNIPCYFYFNAYCNKGEHCEYLHDITSAQKFPKTASEPTTFLPPDEGDHCEYLHDITSAQKFPKTASEPTTFLPPEVKTSTGSDTGSASVEVPSNHPVSTPELVKQYQAKEVNRPAHATNLVESSPSGESSVPECEEPAINLTGSPIPAAEYKNNSNGQYSLEQSSEEVVKECGEPEEWWESSPGFDVLVDDGSEQLAYQDDAEYLVAQERESEMLHNHLMQYDFEGTAGYDPLGYSDAGYLYEGSLYKSYDHLENRRTPEYFERDVEHLTERFLEPAIHQKRRLSRRECDMNDRGADLRDRLRKRRRMDAQQVSDNSLDHHSSRSRGRSRERANYGTGPLLRDRLSSEVGKNMIGSSHGETESVRNDRHRRGWLGHTQSNRHARSRRRESKRRHGKAVPGLSSEISQGLASKEASSKDLSSCFPVEQKRTSKAGSNGSERLELHRSTRPTSADFEGPKPLSELLKERRKYGAVSGNTHAPADTTSKQQQLESVASQVDKRVTNDYLVDSLPRCHRSAEKQGGNESDFLDDYDDEDDDSLQKKIAHIFMQ